MGGERGEERGPPLLTLSPSRATSLSPSGPSGSTLPRCLRTCTIVTTSSSTPSVRIFWPPADWRQGSSSDGGGEGGAPEHTWIPPRGGGVGLPRLRSTHAYLPVSQPHLHVLDELQSPIPSHCQPVPYLYVLDELQERRALQLFSLRIGIGGGEGVGQGYPPPPLPLPT